MLLTLLTLSALQDAGPIQSTKVCADGSVLPASAYCREDVIELTCVLRAYQTQTPSDVAIRLEPGADRAQVTYRSMKWPEHKAKLAVRPEAFNVTTSYMPNGTLVRLNIDRASLTITESAHAPMIGTTMTRNGSCAIATARP